MSIPPVVIVGGGPAGIAAALRLADAGVRAAIVDRAPRLGGHLTSQDDPVLGGERDDAPHVILASHIAAFDLLTKIGALDRLVWPDALPVCSADGGRGVWRNAARPAPWHALAGAKGLASIDAQLARDVRRILWRIVRDGERDRVRSIGMTFVEWAGQDPGGVFSAWLRVLTGTDASRIAAPIGIQALRDGLLASRAGAAFALAAPPLFELWDRAETALRERGVELHLGAEVTGIAWNGKRVESVVTAAERITATAAIVATSPRAMEAIVGAALVKADRRLTRLAGLPTAPVVTAHFYYAEPVLEVPAALALARHVHWLQERARGDDGGQHLVAVAGDAHALRDLDDDTRLAAIRSDVEACLPAARDQAPLEARAVMDDASVVAFTPATAAVRPGPDPDPVGGPGVRNLLLAGAVCDTGWTGFESAVRSGLDAAEAWCNHLEDVAEPPLIVGLDAPPGRFVKLLTRGG